MSKTNLTSAEYWRERANLREAAIWKKAGVFERAVAENAARTIEQIERDIRALYSRYATVEGLSLAEAYKELNATEVKNLHARLTRLHRKSGDAGIMREISRLSMKSRITRFEAMALSLQESASRMAGENVRIVERAIEKMYREGRYRIRFDVAKAVGRGNASLAQIDEKAVARMIKMPLAGEYFSDRIWSNKKSLTAALQRTLTQSLAGGYSVAKATDLFRLNIEASKSNALRIVRTEIAHAVETANLDEYEELGVQEYQFIATLDDRTSEICAALDGEHFPIEAAEEGVNYPPMHPNCRSTTVPYIEGGLESRIARDLSTGKSYLMDRFETYEEWAEENL